MVLIVSNCPNKQSVCTSSNDFHCDQCDHELVSVWPPLRGITEVGLLLARHCTSTEVFTIYFDDLMLKIQLIGDLR